MEQKFRPEKAAASQVRSQQFLSKYFWNENFMNKKFYENLLWSSEVVCDVKISIHYAALYFSIHKD